MNKKIIVIPFNLPWDWSTDYTNQTAFVLGKNNLVICYMWSDCLSIKEYFIKRKLPVMVKKYSENIFQFYPILLIPFRRFSKIIQINEYLNIFLLKCLIRILSIGHKNKQNIFWVFDPRIEPLIKYFTGHWKIVYDCIDYFIGTGATRVERELLAKAEIRLTQEADLVVANSTVLKKHLEKIRRGIDLVPQGFRIDTFEKYVNSGNTTVLKRRDRPLIGFVGAINYRIDYKLVYQLARKRSNWDFVVWGPELQVEQFSKEQRDYLSLLKTLPNLIFGKSEKSEIPGIVRQFDVGMIPYITDDDFNKYCFPMKLFEFFYFGLPVVSVEIEELKRFPDFVSIVNNISSDWEKAIENYISTPWPIKYKNKERNLAIKNSWENKVNQIVGSLNWVDDRKK